MSDSAEEKGRRTPDHTFLIWNVFACTSPGGLPESGCLSTLHPNHHHISQSSFSTPCPSSPINPLINSSLHFTMSSLNVPGPSPYASFFRHRTLGRAPSPPTWACYEQIQYDDEYSDDSASDGDSNNDDDEDGDDNDNTCSEDDEDYGHHPDSSSSSVQGHEPPQSPEESEKSNGSSESTKKDVKGKGRAVDPEHEEGDSPPPPPRSRLPTKKRRSGRRARTLRPILTIHKSQGFVWNQVCDLSSAHLTSIIKRSYVASTGPLCAPIHQRSL